MRATKEWAVDETRVRAGQERERSMATRATMTTTMANCAAASSSKGLASSRAAGRVACRRTAVRVAAKKDIHPEFHKASKVRFWDSTTLTPPRTGSHRACR